MGKFAVVLLMLGLQIVQAQEKQQDKRGNIFVNAICSGYKKHPSIRSGLRELFAQSESVPLAKSGFLPTVSVFANGQQSIKKGEGFSSGVKMIEKSKTKQSAFGVNVVQNVYKGFQHLNSVSKAKKELNSAVMSFVGLEQKSILDSIDAYANLWQAYEVFKLRETSVQFHKRNLEEVKAQVELGEKSKTELAEAGANLAGAISNKINSQAEVLSAQAKYERIVGEKSPHKDVMIAPYCLLKRDQMPKKITEVKELVLRNSPAIQAAAYKMQAAKSFVSIERGAFLPSMDMELQAERYVNERLKPGTTAFGNNTTVSLKVNVPIFQGGKEWSGLRRSQQEQYRAISEHRKARLEVLESSTSSWYLWKAAMNYVTQVGRQVKAAKITLEGKKQEYLVGEIPLTLFLEAEQKLVNAKINQIKGRVDYVMRFYQLLSVYGGLLPDNLKLPAERYKINEYITGVSNKFFGTGNLQRSISQKEAA